MRQSKIGKVYWVGLRYACKCYIRAEVADSDKTLADYNRELVVTEKSFVYLLNKIYTGKFWKQLLIVLIGKVDFVPSKI